jgi:hypothetical protein
MNGVERVLFQLPEVMRADVVLIAEGEKDALRLMEAVKHLPNKGGTLAYAATTNSGGAGKWQSTYSPYLAGKTVFVFADNDEAGRKHAAAGRYERAAVCPRGPPSGPARPAGQGRRFRLPEKP